MRQGGTLAVWWEGMPMNAGLMKLTALSVVLGVGLLAVLQARRSAQDAPSAQNTSSTAALGAEDSIADGDNSEPPPEGNAEPSLADDAEELLNDAVSAQQKTAATRSPRRAPRITPRSTQSAGETDEEFDRLLSEAADEPAAAPRGTSRATPRTADFEEEEPSTQSRAVTRVGANPGSRANPRRFDRETPEEDAVGADTAPEEESSLAEERDALDDELPATLSRRGALTRAGNNRPAARATEPDEPADSSDPTEAADTAADELDDADDAGFSGRPLRGRPQLRRAVPATEEMEEPAEDLEERGSSAADRRVGTARSRFEADEEPPVESSSDDAEADFAEPASKNSAPTSPALRGRPRLSAGAAPRGRVVTVAADEELEAPEAATSPTSELEEADDGFAPRNRASKSASPRAGTRFESEDEPEAEPVPTPREAAPLDDEGPTGALADEDWPTADGETAPSQGGNATGEGTAAEGTPGEPGDGAGSAAGESAKEEPADEPAGANPAPRGGTAPGEPEEEQPRPTLEEEEDPLTGPGNRPGGKSPSVGAEDLDDEPVTPAPARSPNPATVPVTPAPVPAPQNDLAEDDEPLSNQRRNGVATKSSTGGTTTRGNGLATPDTGDVPAGTGGASRKPRPKLSIEKRAPDTAVLGRPMVYEIVVKNSGVVAAQGVTVEDVVPSGLQIEATKPQAQLDGRRLSWRLGTLEPGASETIAVRVIPLSEGTVGGVATVHFDNQREGAASTGPRLQINVDAPRKATVGQTVAVTFKIRNLGSTLATGVLIHNVLPAGLRHPAGDDLEFEIGDLPPGGVREVTLQMQAAQAGTAVNRSIVTADGAVSEEAVTQLDLIGPALDVARTGTRRLNPGKKGRFVNTVTNPTTNPLARVTLTETVPSGLEFVEAGEGGRYDESRRTVTWELGPLGPREARSVSLSLGTAGRGSQISVVRASDPSGASGEAVGTLQVVGTPALSIEAPDLPGAIDAGQEAQATYRIYNRGTDAALNSRVVLSIPGNLEVVTVDGPVKYQSGAVGGARQRTEIRLDPIRSIDVKKFAEIRLTLRGRAAGGGRVKVQAACDQAADPILREDDLQVVAE